MKYLSVCSGIEAASAAWHGLGWQPLAFSEIEAFPRAVLAHHYPGVPLHGDFTKLRDESWIADADILVGGTPCQAFSVAGLRKSLDDDRGNLTLEFVRLADAIDDARLAAGRDAGIVVWENVPGVLSVKDNAFGCFLGAMAGEDTALIPTGGKWTDFGVVIGPRRRLAWRVLDAQYFGLAQRRRRVFVVASARDGFDPLQVLSQPNGVQRHTPPRREAGKIAPTIPARSLGGGGLGTDFDCDGGVIQSGEWPADIAPTLNAHFGEKQGLEDQHIRGGVAYSYPPISKCLNAGGMGRIDMETESFVAETQLPEDENEPLTFPWQQGGTLCMSGTLGMSGTLLKHQTMAVAIPEPYTLAIRGRGDTHNLEARQDGTANALLTPNGGRGGIGIGAVAAGMAVRRLTPVECERLQGFPDGYTDIPWRGKPSAPDGPRYKALGNSMAVPVMRWIGERIASEIARTESHSHMEPAA